MEQYIKNLTKLWIFAVLDVQLRHLTVFINVVFYIYSRNVRLQVWCNRLKCNASLPTSSCKNNTQWPYKTDLAVSECYQMTPKMLAVSQIRDPRDRWTNNWNSGTQASAVAVSWCNQWEGGSQIVQRSRAEELHVATKTPSWSASQPKPR